MNNFIDKNDVSDSKSSIRPLTVEDDWKERINMQMGTLIGFGQNKNYNFSLKTKLEPTKAIDLNMKLDRIANSQMENRDMYNKASDSTNKTTDTTQKSVFDKSYAKKSFHPRHSKITTSMKSINLQQKTSSCSFDNKEYRIQSQKNLRSRYGLLEKAIKVKKMDKYQIPFNENPFFI